ncbi:MAG: hypothetical protein OHK0057_22910 [Thermoflexibacter sp.]
MRIVFTETAKMRLLQVFEYYKEFLGTEKAKQKVQKIKNHTKQLAQMPYSGAKEVLLENEPEEYRYLVDGNYKNIYHIDKERVIIGTVFDTRQDLASLEEEIK